MTDPSWNLKAGERAARLARARAALGPRLAGKRVDAGAITELLHAVLAPGDRVCLEGNNQKQADFLAGALVQLDPQQVHDLHMVQSVLALPEHLDVFENGIARRLDFSFSGPQGARLAKLVSARQLEIGAIHTYLELFARYFVDLTPKVALVAAHAADAQGNLYTGPNTEDTPAIVEATAFSGGIVIAQVNEMVDGTTTALPRVDIPSDWVHFVVQAPRPNVIEPLFTRDPAQISEIQVLMAMMAIKGIYAEYEVQRLNHGIGFDTAAIELLLPTYGESLGLKGRIARHWALNPHPALIPAIEAGWVESIHSFGSELGMEDYIRARSDVFFTGADGSLRSNRAFCQAAGHYACDLFIGSTLQIDLDGNSSTATLGRIAGFGGAPNMGADARGRRHASAAWLKAGREARAGRSGAAGTPRGQKLVVQMVETFREHMQPAFVERLDAWTLQEQAGMDLPPIMIYGEDVTHILTEEGIANLLLCRSDEEREQAIRGVAGYTAVGLARCADQVVMSDIGRLAMSGPEVIEASHGVDEFDARDRALVWRTTGGKHRWLCGDCDALVADDVEAFRAAAIAALDHSRPVSLEGLLQEHALLRARLDTLDALKAGSAIGPQDEAMRLWQALGVPDAWRVPDLDAAAVRALRTTPATGISQE